MHSMKERVAISKLKVINDVTHELSRNPGTSNRHFLNQFEAFTKKSRDDEDIFNAQFLETLKEK